jgi:hypothetical protein
MRTNSIELTDVLDAIGWFRFIRASDLRDIVSQIPSDTQIGISRDGIGLIFCSPPDEGGKRDVWGSITFHADGSADIEDFRR